MICNPISKEAARWAASLVWRDIEELQHQQFCRRDG